MSIECEEMTRLLYPYQDGTLASSERERVAEHLTVCNDCRLELFLIQRIDEAISTEPLIEPGRNFTKAVMARIPGEARHPVLNWWGILPWLGGYLAAASVLSTVLYQIIITLWWKPASLVEETITGKILSIVMGFVKGFDERLRALTRETISIFGTVDPHQFMMPFAVLTSFLLIFIVRQATDAICNRLESFR